MTPDIIEQLEWAEGWFDATGSKTIPVEREHGLWLFRESLKAITTGRAEGYAKAIEDAARVKEINNLPSPLREQLAAAIRQLKAE